MTTSKGIQTARPVVITIDGPAGSGKSTVARLLASKLGFLHLNSGALYRFVGVEAERNGVRLDDEGQLASIAEKLDFQFVQDPLSGTRLCVNRNDVTDLISGEHAGRVASKIATLPRVRSVLTAVQRRVGENQSLVLEGRDAGTVVFPHADAKFYLDASLEVRAERRFRELLTRVSSPETPKSTGVGRDEIEAVGEIGAGSVETSGGEKKGNEAVVPVDVTVESVRSEIADRDYRDSNRSTAPQVRAEDAIPIDTSTLNADQVVVCIVSSLRERRVI